MTAKTSDPNSSGKASSNEASKAGGSDAEVSNARDIAPNERDADGSAMDHVVTKVSEAKEKFKSVQSEITGIEGHGSAADGLVKATCDGVGNIKTLTIDPALMQGEPAVLSELVRKAIGDAKADVQGTAGEKLSDLLGGLPLPSAITALLTQYLPTRQQ